MAIDFGDTSACYSGYKSQYCIAVYLVKKQKVNYYITNQLDRYTTDRQRQTDPITDDIELQPTRIEPSGGSLIKVPQNANTC